MVFLLINVIETLVDQYAFISLLNQMKAHYCSANLVILFSVHWNIDIELHLGSFVC